MPRPAYIVCALSGSLDRDTGRMSFYNVVDVLAAVPGQATLNPDQPEAGGQEGVKVVVWMAQPIRLTAAWLREEGDEAESEFEVQVGCVAPDGEEVFSTSVSTFRFTAPFHRLNVHQKHPNIFPSLGMHIVESRIRRAGETEWLHRQQFPIIVQGSPLPEETDQTVSQQPPPEPAPTPEPPTA
jgi:hypothetical protein